MRLKAVANPHKQAMETALKAKLVPALRGAGFTGSYPKWRRVVGDRLDFVDIQYSTSGGRFYVNLGQAPAIGFVESEDDWLASIPLEKLDASYCADRTRVLPETSWWKGRRDWEYGPRYSYPDPVPVRPAAWYEELADTVAERFGDAGEAWFAAPDKIWRGDDWKR